MDEPNDVHATSPGGEKQASHRVRMMARRINATATRRMKSMPRLLASILSQSVISSTRLLHSSGPHESIISACSRHRHEDLRMPI